MEDAAWKMPKGRPAKMTPHGKHSEGAECERPKLRRRTTTDRNDSAAEFFSLAKKMTVKIFSK
jgi:hypothetical protein